MNKIFENEIKKPYVQSILNKIKHKRLKKTIYPAQEDIFNSLKLTNFEQLKVIILGQDPYHQPGMADGLAFSSLSILPKSLNNIIKEIQSDYPNLVHESNSLRNWAKQGVLLMNTIWSVEQDKPLSHSMLGWQKFSLNILKMILKKYDGIVVCLWGNKAKEFVKSLDLSKQFVLINSHPSPLGYYRNFKDKHIFKQINELISKQNKSPINWDLTKE